jgi:hypothetical protein
LIAGLGELGLVEIDRSLLGSLTARLSVLLQRSGADARDAPDAAQALARDIAKLRGVGALFATPGDLQIALRRTQDPPTEPVVMRVP